MSPQDHKKALGIIHLAQGGFNGLLMLVVFAIMFFIIAPAYKEAGELSDLKTDLLIMFTVMTFGLLFALSSVIAGYALLKRKAWARTAAIVAGILAIPSFPYGTALGVYTLWLMLGKEGKAINDSNAIKWPGHNIGALPGANPAGNWAASGTHKQREREYVPPPQMPDWR